MKGECTTLEYYQNYHKHTSLSHRYNKDSSLVPMDYFKTMKPLADKGIPQIYSTVEHGWQGNYFKEYLDLQKFNEDNAKDNSNYKPIKFVFGTEAYWVKDHKAKDKSNNHIILLAKNDNGRKALNEAICKSFITEESIQNGTARNMFPNMNLQDDDIYYYYKNRMDLDLLETLPKDDIFVTTACVAYWLGYSNLDNWADIDECVLRMNNHFTDFYLEVQANNTEKQKKINRHIMELHYKYDIPIIAATDSHEITMSQMQDREYLLESNNISYPEEDGNYIDFPNIDVLKQRFKEQGILTEAEWNEAINNTNIILNFEDIDLISKTWQIPIAKQFKGLSQEERNQKLKDLIIKQWREQFNDINKDKLQQYHKEIQHDYNEIIKCNMADYFLDDYLILKTGQEKYHGILTSTGRGSAVGMYINKLLGFTKVDKVNSPVQMYSERFMTADRINSGTAPDVDNNVATREPFIQAERDIVGYNGVFDIMALGLLKYKSAFKMFARANNLNPQLQNIVTSQIDTYENAVKYKEDDETEDDYDIHNYVDSKYWDLIDGCQKYRGIVDHLGASPCATILYDGNVIRDVGVIMIKSETTKKETWIALQESSTMDTCKFLKNDILIVNSIGLAKDIYDEIGMKPFTINELLNEIENDKKVWDIYKNGYTMCINQVEQDKSKAKVMRYKPTNISELCQFVAAIRPGFQSMYNKFEKRENFEYGIKSLDNIIQDQYRNSSFIIYQEDLMKILGFAGFSMTETYPIIKAISKKKKYVIESAKDRFIPNFTKAIMNSGDTDSEDKAKEIAKKVWQIIEDNASYSFNCVTGDTKLYRDSNGGYTPTIAEMYQIMNDASYAKKNHHKALYNKYHRDGYGYTLSLGADGRIYKNQIIDIYKQPKAMTYLITTESGKTIKATANHKFPIVGYKEKKTVSELQVGDSLYIKGDYEKDTTPYNFTDGNFVSNVPLKGQKGFQSNKNGATVLYNKFRLIHINNKCCCEDCGKQYSDTERFEVHHKDFNRYNNTFNNYVWLCASCHKKRHYDYGRKKKGDKGYPTYSEKIISIVENGVEDVYDVSMSSDVSHTFVIDNGIVTSNCSHSYCMALDSVTLAWQKAYHPYEFYKVCLERYTNKGDKNKVTKIKQEMNQMGIKLSPLKFHEDNRHFLVSPTHEYITQRLDSIKLIQKTAPQFLYELGQHQYLSFMDLLKVLEENKKLCNNTSIVKLIKLNYFSEFGSVNKLLLEKNLYDEFASKKIFKKDKYQNNKLYYQGLQLYATEQKTRFTNLDFKQFAKFIIERTYINDVTVMDMAQSEIQYTGYSIKTIKDCKYGIVANVKTDKYNSNKHTVSLYSLSTGQIKDFATDKKWFAETELNEGDIINPIFNKIPLRVVNEKGERVASKTQFYWELSMWSIVKKGD